jgi:hypothetical protein
VEFLGAQEGQQLAQRLTARAGGEQSKSGTQGKRTSRKPV